jgi:plastocyanin
MLAAAPSKVPFYVVGGLLACWAVLLAGWGISHEEFPGSQRKGQLVMLASFILVVATMASAVLTAGEAEEGAGAPAGVPAASGRTLDLAADPAGALAYDKRRAAVFAGRVTVRFTNDASVAHNVTIAQGPRTLAATKTIAAAKDSLSVNLSAGEYVFFCSVSGHRQAGMEGTLVVE